MKNFFNVLFVIAVTLWLYSCATMFDIEKLHWESGATESYSELISEN